MRKGGDNCNMNDDREILSTDSPKKDINGPYIVIAKNITERWAIAAFDFDNKPRLGIRWFTETSGSPISRGYPIWFILPVSLNSIILDGLNLDSKFKELIALFLDEKEQGTIGPVLAIIGEIKNLFTLNGYDESRIFAMCHKQFDKLIKAKNAEEREKDKRLCKEKMAKTKRILNEDSSVDRDKRILEMWEP